MGTGAKNRFCIQLRVFVLAERNLIHAVSSVKLKIGRRGCFFKHVDSSLCAGVVAVVLAVHALLRVIRTRVGSVSTYVRKKRLPYEKETSECDSFCVVLPKDLITLLQMSYLIKKDVS